MSPARTTSLGLGANRMRRRPLERRQDIPTFQWRPGSPIPSLQKDRLWKVSFLVGLLSVQAVVALEAVDGRLLRERRQQADAQIQQRLAQEFHDCTDVIVTLASSSGNSDVGTSEFVRTNAFAMPCISVETYNSLMASPEVLLVEIDAPVHTAIQTVAASTSTNATYVDGEMIPWGADRVLQQMWDEIPDPDPQGDDFTICVVDSGLLVSHPDIPFEATGSNILGMEFDLDEDATWDKPVAYAFHGTHISGIMMAKGFNALGLRGIIPRNGKFKLLVARVFGDQMIASARTSSIEKAVEWCADNGANVINLSLASVSPTLNSQLLYTKIAEENILIIAAAGNQGTNDPSYPAGYEHVMSVGSVNPDLTRSGFSQYGPSLDLVAPGESIFSTVPSSGLLADDSTTYDAGPMVFTPVSNVPISGEIVDCGFGDVVCSEALGKVCLVEHSLQLPFHTLALNCENGGGVSLIVFPGYGADELENAVMELEYSGSIPVLTVSRDNGLRLLAKRGTLASISFTMPAYQSVSGTSMSAAHVSALAAKLWAARPQCSSAQIREALETTALDLGPPGRDDEYGHGLVQGIDAYHYLLSLPAPCGTGTFPHPLGNPDRPVTLRKTPPADPPNKERICNLMMNPFCKRGGESAPERRQKRGLRKV